jgi:hypothetical protein
MAAHDTIQVNCPCCSTILIVERKSGKVLEERRPLVEQSTGDRYEDAFLKVKQRPGQAAEKFNKFQAEQDARKQRLNALFDERLKEHSESGEEIEKVNPLEMD